MVWFCSGYFPRRFILADVRRMIVRNIFARVEKQNNGLWRWTTFIGTFGNSASEGEAMEEASNSIDERIGPR